MLLKRLKKQSLKGLSFLLTLCWFSYAVESANADTTLRLNVKSGATSGTAVPVRASVTLGAEWANVPAEEIRVSLREAGKDTVAVGQIVKLEGNQAELWWMLPEARADSTATWTATLSRGAQANNDSFLWQDKAGENLDLLLNGKPVTRYMYAYDTSTPARTNETYKPYLHVFDAAGKEIITKGAGGQFPHHRGIYIGWNNITFNGQKYDLWHMTGTSQIHQKFLTKTAGTILARSTSLVHWNDKEKQPILIEERETTVYRQPGSAIALLDFHSRLTAPRGDVALNGDLEHAGVHFRPHDDAGKKAEDIANNPTSTKRTVPATYAFHKDGINPVKERDLPWAGMSYLLHDRRYSVQEMNAPTNPKDTTYSAHRDYGRFGAFFKHNLKQGETLDVRYRFWIVEGAMPSREEMNAKWAAFATPPTVEVAK